MWKIGTFAIISSRTSALQNNTLLLNICGGSSMCMRGGIMSCREWLRRAFTCSMGWVLEILRMPSEFLESSSAPQHAPQKAHREGRSLRPGQF